jgi:hypothetical protein
VDSAVVFLGLEPRRDLIKDFRSISIKRNPDLRYLILAKYLNKLRQRRDFTNLSKQINKLST